MALQVYGMIGIRHYRYTALQACSKNAKEKYRRLTLLDHRHAILYAYDIRCIVPGMGKFGIDDPYILQHMNTFYCLTLCYRYKGHHSRTPDNSKMTVWKKSDKINFYFDSLAHHPALVLFAMEWDIFTLFLQVLKLFLSFLSFCYVCTRITQRFESEKNIRTNIFQRIEKGEGGFFFLGLLE